MYKSLGVGRVVGEPSGGRLRLYWPDLAVFERGAAGAAQEHVAHAEARVQVVGDALVVEGGGSSWVIPFKPLRGRESLFVGGVGLWDVLVGLGVLAAREPEGVRLGREGVWGLLAAAVEAGGRPPVGVGYVGRGVVVFRVGGYVALLQELYNRGYLAQYSMAPRLSREVEVINLRYHGGPLPQVVNVKFPSEVGGGDGPDALGLMQDGRRVLWLEVSKVEGGTFEDLYRGFRGKLDRLVEEGLFDGRRFTRRGVALVGLAVDAGSGATVDAPLAERYGALEYVAYPRVESQIFRWHRALDRSVGVAPLFVTYQVLGRQLVARFVLLDDVPKGERDLKSAVERCFR